MIYLTHIYAFFAGLFLFLVYCALDNLRQATRITLSLVFAALWPLVFVCSLGLLAIGWAKKKGKKSVDAPAEN